MPYYLASNGHRSGKSCNMNSSAPLVSMRRSTSNNLASSTSTAGTAQLGSTKGHSNVLSWAKNLLVLVVLILAGGRISLMVLHYFHPHAHFVLRDLLINQEMLKVPHSATIVASSSTLRVGIERVLASEPLSSTQTVDYVARGRLRASQSSVTFLGVAKDAGYYIPRVLQQIEEMAAYFPKSQAILIEGDSVDNTAQVIEAWRQLSPSNRTVLTYSLIDAMETVPAFNGSIMPREGRLSLARNKALEQLNFHAPTEYIVMVDLDIVGVSMEGFLDTFGRDGWMAMCAHGVILSSFYRDTYAFRMPGLDTNHHKCGSDHLLYGISPEERSQNRKLVEAAKAETKRLMDYTRYLNEADESLKLIPLTVNSCFGGLAIYKAKAIQGCRYGYRESNPPYMLDCEHVFFNQCLRDKNPQEKIMSNPYMKLWYGHANLRAASKFVDNLWRRSN